MGKEVDFEALAAQYVWEHLNRMNMNVSSLRRWRSDKTVLFTMSFGAIDGETQLPLAVLTEDGILRFFIGFGEVDLKLGGGNPFKSIG